MPVILVDANIEGHGACIWGRMQAADWRALVKDLAVELQFFRDVSLYPSSADDLVWRFCQANGMFLLTSNRNADSNDSLETILRNEGRSDSLPVMTLPLPDRVFESPLFLERVVEKLLEYLLDIDNIRGTGRLYIP